MRAVLLIFPRRGDAGLSTAEQTRALIVTRGMSDSSGGSQHRHRYSHYDMIIRATLSCGNADFVSRNTKPLDMFLLAYAIWSFLSCQFVVYGGLYKAWFESVRFGDWLCAVIFLVLHPSLFLLLASCFPCLLSNRSFFIQD